MARWSLHPTVHTHARIVLIPTAFGVNTQAPTAILNAGADLCAFEPLLNVDVDNLEIAQLSPLVDEPPFGMCEAAVQQRLKRKQWPVLLPSVMSATWGAIRALWKINPDFTVVHCSAHANLLPTLDQRQKDEGYGQTFWIEHLYQYKLASIHVGLRSSSSRALDWFQHHKTPVFWAQTNWDPEAVVAALPDLPVFLVIDSSVLDPSMIPTVTQPEPGGLSWNQLVQTCDHIFSARPVLGLSIGGLSVTDGTRQTSRFVARLLNWLLARYSLTDAF
jgi:agmatinase